MVHVNMEVKKRVRDQRECLDLPRKGKHNKYL